MTYFPDLSPYSYRANDTRPALNVGWLASGHAFPTGVAPKKVVRAILRMVAEHRLVNRTRGWQECFLCPDGPYPIRMDFEGTELALGDAEIRVVGRDGTVYAAPNLVAHYIDAHSYLPPSGFIDAFPDETPDPGHP